MENILSPLNMKLLHFLLDAVLGGLILIVLIKLISFLLNEASGVFILCQKIHREGLGSIPAKENSNKNNKKPNYVKTSLITASVAALLFIVAAVLASKKFGLNISPDNVVLTFAGILATFIVVTNYAQVIDIKKEMNDKINILDRQIKKQMRDNQGNNPNRQAHE